MASEVGCNRPTITPDPSASTFEQRVARVRERTWLILYIADRTYAAGAGRKYTIPEDESHLNVVKWANHPLALPIDRKIAGSVLRNRLVTNIIESLPLVSEHPLSQVHIHTLYKLWSREIRKWELDWVENDPENEDVEETVCSSTLGRLYVCGVRLQLCARMMALCDISERPRWEAECLNIAWQAIQAIEECSHEQLRIFDNHAYGSVAYACFIAIRFRESSGDDNFILKGVEELAARLDSATRDPPHKGGPAIDYAALIKASAAKARSLHRRLYENETDERRGSDLENHKHHVAIAPTHQKSGGGQSMCNGIEPPHSRLHSPDDSYGQHQQPPTTTSSTHEHGQRGPEDYSLTDHRRSFDEVLRSGLSPSCTMSNTSSSCLTIGHSSYNQVCHTEPSSSSTALIPGVISSSANHIPITQPYQISLEQWNGLPYGPGDPIAQFTCQGNYANVNVDTFDWTHNGVPLFPAGYP